LQILLHSTKSTYTAYPYLIDLNRFITFTDEVFMLTVSSRQRDIHTK